MEKAKKIVVFYYTQTGQALDILKSMNQPLVEAGHQVVYKEIVPERPFPFLWSKNNFFEVFPEARLGIPPYGIREIDLSDVQDADLVMVGGQSWYLSPSLPLQSFFLSPTIKEYLKGKSIIFVNGCRNMWLMTIRKIRKYVAEAGGNLVGHIVLQDYVANLVSVITVIRWLFHGKKEASSIWPRAGVSEEDIHSASRFGCIIDKALQLGNWSDLQEQLMAAGAIKYKPGVVYIEKVGHRIFGLWAKFIRRKGEYENPDRAFRVKLFSWYLIFILFAISPIGLLVFYLTYPIRMFFIGRQKREACYSLSWKPGDSVE